MRHQRGTHLPRSCASNVAHLVRVDSDAQVQSSSGRLFCLERYRWLARRRSGLVQCWSSDATGKPIL
eukprot:3436648-Amphidinium_carterae.1